MGFTNTLYETDSGVTMRIRLDDDTVAAAGAPPAGPADVNAFVKVSKTDREFGLKPRGFLLGQSETTAGGRDVTFYRFLPQLTLAAYNAAAEGSSITVGGETYELVSKKPEDG